jgi:hypothetical protein
MTTALPTPPSMTGEEERAAIVGNPQWAVVNPAMSDWACHLFGSDGYGITYRPRAGAVPNRFWRWMQFLCFGHRWVHIPTGEER